MTATKLIIGEGASDEAFFRAFLAIRNIQGYDVEPRNEKAGSGSGYFERALRAQKIRTDVPVDMRNLIVIVADNDEDPAASFARVRGQIQAAGDFGIPRTPSRIRSPRTINAAFPFPRIVVLMLPGPSACGALESLCYESAKAHWPKKAACIETFAKCIGANKWETSKKDKLMLGCLMAGVCKRNPDVTLRRAWVTESRCPDDMIPLDHVCFDWIAKLLIQWGDY